MAYIEKRRGKNGVSFSIRFYYHGSQRRISLDSKYSESDANAAADAVDAFLRSEQLNEPLDRKTRVYFENAPADLIKRFSVIGLAPARNNMTVDAIFKIYVRYLTTDVKYSTIVHRETVFNRFRAYFPAGTKFADLTRESILEFRDELARLYAPTTVSKSIADLRTFGKFAVERGFAAENPFMFARRGPTGNRSRDFQIPAEWTPRILNACPTQTWRVLYCLWRHAGLRQQEPLTLTRESVDLRSNRLSVHSSKTERYGEEHANRIVPIVPIVHRELERLIDQTPKTEKYLIVDHRRKGFDSGFRRIQFDAGLERWPKTFQNMRSSCENDWIADGIPAHVVAAWLGHSVRTQEKFYLRVLPEYFDRVTA